jgi:hypothetical protein
MMKCGRAILTQGYRSRLVALTQPPAEIMNVSAPLINPIVVNDT